MTQYERVLAYLKAGNSLSAPQALGLFGQMSLAVAIYKLRKLGHPVQSKRYRAMNGKPFVSYSIPKEARS